MSFSSDSAALLKAYSILQCGVSNPNEHARTQTHHAATWKVNVFSFMNQNQKENSLVEFLNRRILLESY